MIDEFQFARRKDSTMSRIIFKLLFAFALCPLVCYLTGCSKTPVSRSASNSVTSTAATDERSSQESGALFKDVAAQAGLSFKHILGDTGRFYFIESTPPGCAFIDFDNDDYLDILLIQSGSSEKAATVHQRPHCVLYHNNRDGTFTDVTAGSGLDKDLGYGHGAAVGDFDNDGFDDLFITAYGSNHLFRNRRGSGKFEDVTQVMGLGKRHGYGYATSAAWGDYDNDGRLDLYVCFYSVWSQSIDKPCLNEATKQPDYCHPKFYDPVTHCLYHNEGKRFVDVSDKSGISKAKGRGLSAAWTDYNNDGRPDIFVANDVTPSMLWKNNGNGTFTNVAAQMGCAYDGEGVGIAGMGIAIADYDRSGRESLYISNFSGRPNILFKNHETHFEDVSAQANLGFSHLKFLSFGCEFFDYDADGWSDLITNNGQVFASGEKQRKQLLHNEHKGTFREITNKNELGDLAEPMRGRGLAIGDYDNDGRLDVLAVAQNASAQLFHNQVKNGNHWISFKAIGTPSNRDGIHAHFALQSANGRQIATVSGGSSYLSASDRRVYFGLGSATKVNEVTIRWPSGTSEVLKNLTADTFYTVTEGRGVTHTQHPSQ